MKKWIKEQVKKVYHRALWKGYFPCVYKRAVRRSVEPRKIVFVEQQINELSDSLRLLYDTLKAQGHYKINIHCLREGYSPALKYLHNAKVALRDIATAEAVFLCEGSRLISCVKMREETKVAQVWHGCGAFKKFGASTANHLFGGNLKEMETYSYYKNQDVVTVSSPEVVWAYQEAMSLANNSNIIKPFGISRTDVFFDDDFIKNRRRQILKQVPAIGAKEIILYAPTYRGDIKAAEAPNALDLRAMKKRLSDKYVLLIKHHPKVKNRPIIASEVADFAFDVSATCDIADLICASDICIADYSSLIFEYSLMERPMIFFAYDLDDYEDWRGFYYDYDELTPGPVVKTTAAVIACIEDVSPDDMDKISAFKQKFMSACDGKATARLLEYLNLL